MQETSTITIGDHQYILAEAVLLAQIAKEVDVPIQKVVQIVILLRERGCDD